MWRIAIDMLLRDRTKYYTLISVLAFSTLLIVEQMGILSGVMKWMSSPIINANAPIWVMDPIVKQVAFQKDLPESALMRVKSVEGVTWAYPYYSGLLDIHVPGGAYMPVRVIGLDDNTLVGMPSEMIAGKLSDLRHEDSVILDQMGQVVLSRDLKKKLGIGDIVYIKDRPMKIAGIVKSLPFFDGYPVFYTTYSRSLLLDPSGEKHISYILVKPTKETDDQSLLERIHHETGLLALTEEQFNKQTVLWYVNSSPIFTALGATTLLGFFIGLFITAQTFFSFINDNIAKFSALKAMGASNSHLFRMIMIQSVTAGMIGFGIGILAAVILGYYFVQSGLTPFYLPWQLLLLTFVMILMICLTVGFFGYNRLRKLEPSEVFRA